MTNKDIYVLGINTYDHDVSACLLRNGEIVVAISKERVTRIKHDMGFYQEPVDYCLEAAGIDLDRVDLIVRNCYVLPVDKLETRLVHHDEAGYLDDYDRRNAMKSPLFLTDSDRVVQVSHHLAHAYSAFGVSPFEDGAVMIVDDSVGRGQSQSRTPPAFFCGEKRLKDSPLYFLIHANTRIRDGYFDEISRRNSQIRHVTFIHGDIGGGNGNFATVGHCLPRIYVKIK